MSQIFNAPRILIAAPKSGSGKTTLTCAFLQFLKNHGKNPVSFKCGPDYIDPMFHERVLGVPSANLDSYFCSEEQIREIFLRNATSADTKNQNSESFAVIEGVMGLFDGLAGTSLKASSYDIARITNTPILLVVDAEGASRSIVPLVKGFLTYDTENSGTGENLIKGILLNKTSKSQFMILKKLIEEECAENDIKVVGFLSKNSDDVWKSRHLGLILPSEIENLQAQIQKTAESLEDTLDFEELERIMYGALRGVPAEGVESDGSGTAFTETRLKTRLTSFSAKADGSLGETSPILQASTFNFPLSTSNFPLSASLAVAFDEAFCFYYRENLRMLEEAGFQIKYFSPLHDKAIPKNTDALLLGGGYPELYAAELESNKSMRESIKSALKNGVSVMAECGGFMYLQEKLTTQEGKSYEMCGAIKGECSYTEKLVRFGYAEFTKKADSTNSGCNKMPFSIKGHEFHYFDSTNNGSDFTASKPLSKKSWECMIFTPKMLAGFPHLYYRSNPEIIKWFAESCKKD